MPVLYTFEFHATQEEFDILKQLAQRWLNELRSQKVAIDELPEGLRAGAFEELDEAIETAEHICRELGIDL